MNPRAWSALSAAAVILAACSTPPATAGPSGGSGATAGASAGVGGGALENLRALPSLAPDAATTLLGAANAELETRRRLREEMGLAAALGENGAAILEADQAVETAFGEAGLAELSAKYGLDLTAARVGRQVASIQSLPAAALFLTEDSWSGSLIGATSFTISMYMGFAPQLFPQAGGKELKTEQINRSENHESESNGVRERLVVDQRMTVGVGGGRVQVDVTLTSTSTLTSVATGAEIARRTSTSVGHFDLNGCPSDTGAAEGRYSLVNQEEVTRSVGSNGGASKTEGQFTVFDGDDARLVKTDFTASVAAGAHGPAQGGAAAFDWGVTATFPMSIPARGGVSAISVGDPTASSESNVGPGQTTGLSWMLVTAGSYLGDAARQAEAFWRSGQCIEMKTSVESKTVAPTSTTQFNVTPVHRFDGANVKAQVKASFSGKQQLTPTDQPQDPPASYTFSAGNEKGDKGTVQLEQVGRRGIGKKTLEFTVGVFDYRIDVSAPGFGGLTGVKCNGPEGQWVISMSGSGTNGTIKVVIPQGKDAGEAHAVYDDTSSGVGSIRWDLLGVGTFVDGDKPVLKLGTLTGTSTIKVGGQTVRSPNTQGALDIPLEPGKFCT